MARYWLHNNWLLVEDEKISKSLGNTFYLTDIIERGFDPLSLRYFFLSAHYRKEQRFSWEALVASENTLGRLNVLAHDLISTRAAEARVSEVYREKFKEALSDDLNTPDALAVLWNMLRDPDLNDNSKYKTLLDFDRVFGILAHKENLLYRFTLELKGKQSHVELNYRRDSRAYQKTRRSTSQ
jgi:cysteinyl-tRNA synthetase